MESAGGSGSGGGHQHQQGALGGGGGNQRQPDVLDVGGVIPNQPGGLGHQYAHAPLLVAAAQEEEESDVDDSDDEDGDEQPGEQGDAAEQGQAGAGDGALSGGADARTLELVRRMGTERAQATMAEANAPVANILVVRFKNTKLRNKVITALKKAHFTLLEKAETGGGRQYHYLKIHGNSSDITGVVRESAGAQAKGRPDDWTWDLVLEEANWPDTFGPI